MNRNEDGWEDLLDDPRIGKRVLCLSALSHIILYGKIQAITRGPGGRERWRVLEENAVFGDATSTSYLLWDESLPELRIGDRVGYADDTGRMAEGTVRSAFWANTHVRFVVTRDQGGELALPPRGLQKL